MQLQEDDQRRGLVWNAVAWHVTLGLRAEGREERHEEEHRPEVRVEDGDLVSAKKTPNLESVWSWHVASTPAEISEVSMPQKTEMPRSRSASCTHSSRLPDLDSMYAWLRWTT